MFSPYPTPSLMQSISAVLQFPPSTLLGGKEVFENDQFTVSPDLRTEGRVETYALMYSTLSPLFKEQVSIMLSMENFTPTSAMYVVVQAVLRHLQL